MTPEDIKQDREQGTDGPWRYVTGPSLKGRYHTVMNAEETFIICEAYDDEPDNEANARRIARLPELEEAYLTQAAEIAALKSEQHYTYIGKDGKPRLARDMEDEIECWQTLVRYYLAGGASKSDLRAALKSEGE